MGKTKHEKKFDRNVEISAPILDPEIIKKIHSPPGDQKRDIRHGGFKALLSDFNSQDSTDELTPITDNHLPSYIGISCAVSGYSNYSSYGRKPLDESITKTHKLATTSSKQTPNRSQTNSPLAVRIEQHNIHHVTIDKSNINSVDEERKELTEKLTASAAERRQSPSPIPPTNDDRHHGAYVGARYFPMPEPSKVVNKHIPLLGIDDDVDPDEIVDDDYNKVEKKIASLYGEDFVEDWKESMSHKSKKELHDERSTEKAAPTNLMEIVNLKPTPPKTQQPDEPSQVDVPTPNVKVLANVEKQFLNRLLTDENPPTPKSPSPQPASPISPKLISPTQTRNFEQQSESKTQEYSQTSVSPQHEHHSISDDLHQDLQEPVSIAGDELMQNESKDIAQHDEPSLDSPRGATQTKEAEISSNEPLIEPENFVPTMPESLVRQAQSEHLISIEDDKVLDAHREPQIEYSGEVEISNNQEEAVPADGEIQAAAVSDDLHRSRSSSESSREYARSPESQISSSTVERAPMDRQQQREFEPSEDHIEYEIQSQMPPINNESSPVKVPEKLNDDSSSVLAKEVVSQETDNLVSFSPEPDAALTSETNNNFEEQPKETEDLIKTFEEEVINVNPADRSPENEPDASVTKEQQEVNEPTEDDKGGHHFLDLLKKEESFILERVRLAEQLLVEHGHEMDEERLGRIHSAIGKANLLINKKCNQFRELCEKSITGDANDQYAVLNDDLAGFWDMISIQITDVRKSLENP